MHEVLGVLMMRLVEILNGFFDKFLIFGSEIFLDFGIKRGVRKLPQSFFVISIHSHSNYKVTRSNSHPKFAANFYLDTDCGTENGVMAAMQCTLRQDIEGYKYGSSPAKQHIESWWPVFRRNRSSWWIDFFKNPIEYVVLL